MRVAIIDSHEIVVAGLHMLLGRSPDRVEVVDWPSDHEVDIILYGVDDEASTGHDAQLHALLRNSSSMVVAFGWNPAGREALVAAACGVQEFLPKQLGGDRLMARIEDLHRDRSHRPEASLPQDGDCHPGVQDAGLTSRELEVLTRIASGQTNAEIASTLSIR